MSARQQFLSSLGFELDAFQSQALDALDQGGSVVVAAPTGSGKTVVAHYAMSRALGEGGKAFYTTPLKALSNQKYTELVAIHGSHAVGLLTGDNAINGDAPLVVMTTEVLRNMIYARSGALEGLRYVILDEVHYLQNAYRGPVWEEVIVHTPPGVNLVCLSATVSNAEELADWISTVRGGAKAVIEDRRPVSLHNLYMLGDRHSDRLLMLPTLVDGRPNPEASALDSKTLRHPGARYGARGRLFTPRRAEVVELLAEADMLPAIYFIFSRAACDDAAASCLREAKRLTTSEERKLIREIVERHVAPLSDEDLAVLEYGSWLAGLEAGYAAHHAGMVPPFKEAVEDCFEAGLIKVVFATETLSLGINMPARTVVIEKLTKFSGERHEFLTPGDYTQLTGRAGRRGIDHEGYAVVLWSPFVPFDQVASLVGSRTYTLTSSFRPTYNMAVNLVRRYSPPEAHHLLNLSFAQFRTDREVVRLESQLERTMEAHRAALAAAACERGDVRELRRLLAAAQETLPTRRALEAEILEAVVRLRPGDVLLLGSSRPGRRVAVLTTGRRKGGGVRIRAITAECKVLTLGVEDFPEPPLRVGTLELPQPYNPHSSAFQRQVASSLSALRPRGAAGRAVVPRPAAALEELPPVGGRSSPRRAWRQARARSEQTAARRHPAASCPDLRAHLRALDRAERLQRDAERLGRRVQGRVESLARQFDRVLRLLEAWGYVQGWELSEAGLRLASLYHEADLLVCEAMERGLMDGLGAAELAALVSSFTYEARRSGQGGAPGFPTPRLRRRFFELARLAEELNATEDEAGLPLTRPPDPGFVTLAYAWAQGEDLAEVIGDDEISGGDFVRQVKQLVDLLRQLADLAPEPATCKTARQAAALLDRGVVAASSLPPPTST